MKWLRGTLYRSCNALVIVVLLLGILPPAQNTRSPRFELPIAHAQEAAMTHVEEVMALANATGAVDEPALSPNGASGWLSVAKAEPEVVSPSDLTYTMALTDTTGAVDEPGPSLNGASGGLLATKMAEPEVASPGDLITYTIVLTNSAGGAMEGLVISDPLPDGLAYKPHSAGDGDYDPRTKTLTWDIQELAAGAFLSLTFQARVRGDVLGELVVNLAEVTGRGLADPVQAQATVAVVSRALINPQGGVLVSPSGRVRVEFPGGAVPHPIWAIYRLREVHQLPPSQPGLALRFDLTGEVATDENTAPPFTQFDKPVQLTVDMTELVDEAALGEYQRPFVGYLDEATGRWVHLPLVEQQVGPVLTVEVDHFSTFGGGVEGDPMADFEPDFIPSVLGAQVSQFTGDAVYAIPLYVPSGPGGLQPDLTLRYSSGDVAENWLASQIADTDTHSTSQPGWLGQGWSLPFFGVITRDPKGGLGNSTDYEQHKFTLSLPGVGGRLQRSGDYREDYYYPEFAPEWRVKWIDSEDEISQGNGMGFGSWEAYGPDGTKYIFGQDDQAHVPQPARNGRLQIINWRTPEPCNVDTSEPIVLRWYLTEIRDTKGNTVRITYWRDEVDAEYEGESCTKTRHAAVYPDTIEYGPDGKEVKITFERSAPLDRNDWGAGEWDEPTEKKQKRFHRYKIDEIKVEAWDNTGYEVVRRYILSYYDTSWWEEDIPPKWLTLEKITTVGKDDGELPEMTFIYGKRWDEGTTCGHYNRTMLTEIQNGYGGATTFCYTGPSSVGWQYEDFHDPPQVGEVERCRVWKREVYDGINDGPVQVSQYDYGLPSGHTERGEFWGHAKVVETVYDGSTKVARTVTEFYQCLDPDPEGECENKTLDPRRGRPKKIAKYQCPTAACEAEVYRVENTLGFAGFLETEELGDEWRVWQVVPVASSTFHDDSVRDWTLYLEDNYGNRRAQLSYGSYGGITKTVPGGFFNVDTDMNYWIYYSPDGNPSVNWDGGQVEMSSSTGEGVLYQEMAVTYGKSYHVTAWVRGSGTAKAQLYVHDTTGAGWVGAPASPAKPGTDWRLVQVTYTANTMTGEMRIHLAANFTSTVGTICWDNVTVAEVDTTGNDERTTYWQYYPNTTEWILNRVAQGTVYSGIQAEDEGGSSMMARTWYFYDGNASPQEAPGSKGELMRVARLEVIDPGEVPGEEWPDCVDAYRTSEVEYDYDDYGNLIAETTYDDYGYMCQDSDGNVLPRDMYREPFQARTTQTFYDTTYHQFPITVTNAVGHTSHTEYYGVNDSECIPAGYHFGAVCRSYGPNGPDTATLYTYDPFGRLTKVIRPYDSDTDPTIEYVYDDFYSGPTTRVQTFYRETSGCPGCVRQMFTFYDGLGQKIQTKAEAEDGAEVVVTNTSYDERGLVKEASMPYFSGPPLWDYVTPDMSNKTSYEYDGLGRMEKIIHPDGTTVQMAYNGWQRAVIDPKGHTKVYQEDAFGRLTAVKEFTGTHSLPIWNDQHDLLYATTTYAYDALDNLTTVTDTLGNVTTMDYDMLGRKTQMTDPDMGTWSYDYDAAGNLTRQTDALSQTIAFEYDQLNRLVRKQEAGGGILAEYGYDGGTYGIGYRTVMMDGTKVAEWAYDERGRAVGETRQFVGIDAYTTGYTYDAMDRLVTMTYPGGEVITTTYNAMGLPETLTSSLGETYVTDATSYTAEGRLDLLSLGSGLQVDHEYYAWNTPNGQGRLESIQSGTAGQPTLLQNLSYGYDAVGNVTRITDGDVATNFSYDILDRLTGASGEYSESYGYDQIGNLTYKSGVGSYSYDSDKPHAVISAGGNSYSYDLNGNMTSRGTSYTLTYDAENRLKSVTQGDQTTSFTYDADGRRVKRDTVTDTIVYVGSHYELRFEKQDMDEDLDGDCLVTVVDIMQVVARWGMTSADPDWDPRYDMDDDGDIDVADIMLVAEHWRETCEELAETVKYYTLGGRRVAMRVAPSGGGSDTLYYIHTDHLGSVSLVTCGETGGCGSVPYQGLVAEQRFYPYGDRRYATGDTPTDYGFTGQRLDESTGLMYYGARFYDPALGRFVQADTIVPNPANPQDLNRYAYVRNNPLRYIDPTGYLTEDQIMTHFGVETWEEVLAFFEAGGELEGRWGWLEVLREVELGDKVQVLEGWSAWAWNEETGTPGSVNDFTIFAGTFVDRDGQLFVQSGENLVPANVVGLRGNAYYTAHHSRASGYYGGRQIYAERKYYHLRFDPGRVDWVDVGLGVLSASSDVGLATAVTSASTGNPVGAVVGVHLYGFGQAASVVSPIKTYSEWQRGEATTVDLGVEVVTSVGGMVPVIGTLFDIAGIAYDLASGFQITP